MHNLRCCMYADPAQGRTVNGVVNRYGYSVVNGEKTFGKIGEIDVQSDIDSFLESCDYRLIMDALAPQIGARDFDFDDTLELISQIDTSDPLSVASFMEILQDGFGALPREVKQHYGNNSKLFARDCIGGGAVDFINSFAVDNDGVKTVVENPGTTPNAETGNEQPDIAGIMRQIDAINQKLGGDTAAKGCETK